MDDSAVAGSLQIDLDNPVVPTEMLLLDYNLELTDPLAFNISIILGSMSLNAQDVAFVDPQPGDPFGPTPINMSNFEFMNVPVAAEGGFELQRGGQCMRDRAAAGVAVHGHV